MSFEMAQAQYDAMEPPDFESCPWCGGECPPAVMARDYYYICDDMAAEISLDPDTEREANIQFA